MQEIREAFARAAGPLSRLLAVERGQTMTEFALLIGVIAIVVLLAAIFLGSSVSSLLSRTSTHL